MTPHGDTWTVTRLQSTKIDNLVLLLDYWNYFPRYCEIPVPLPFQGFRVARTHRPWLRCGALLRVCRKHLTHPEPQIQNDSSLTPQAPCSLRTRIQKSQGYNSRTTLKGSPSSDAFGLIPEIVLTVFLAGNVGVHRYDMYPPPHMTCILLLIWPVINQSTFYCSYRNKI